MKEPRRAVAVVLVVAQDVQADPALEAVVTPHELDRIGDVHPLHVEGSGENR